MSLAQIRERLSSISLMPSIAALQLALRFIIRAGVVYPALLVIGLTLVVCLQGRGFAEIPYQLLSAMESAQKLAATYSPNSGQVLIERCADVPPAQTVPMRPVSCSREEIASVSVDTLAEHQGGIIRATYTVLFGVFAFFEICRNSWSLKRARRSLAHW